MRRLLVRRGHECWTAGRAGLSTARDDDLSVYADNQHAALVTHDEEFSRRRKLNVIGWHVWLRCVDLDAVAVVAEHLDAIVARLDGQADGLWLKVTKDGIVDDSRLWE